MLEYYGNRVRYYANQLAEYGRHVSSFEQAITANDLLTKLSHLIDECSKLRLQPNFVKKADRIVEDAFNLTKEVNLRNEITSVSSSTRANKIDRLLRSLAKIPMLYKTMVQCIESDCGLCGVRVIAVSKSQKQRAPKIPLSKALTCAKESARSFNLCPPPWLRLERPEERLVAEYRHKLIVHAEMQAIFFLLSSSMQAFTFPYIGISKKTCLLCGSFIHAMRASIGLFETRANHGKIYPFWTLPRSSEISEEQADLLQSVMVETQRKAAVVMCSRSSQQFRHLPESTNVLTLEDRAIENKMVGPRHWITKPHEDYLRTLEALSETVLDDSDTATDVSDVSVPASRTRDKSACSAGAGCAWKEAKNYSWATWRCTACKNAWYCCKQCQQTDWLKHKFVCKFRSIDSADVLVLDCWTDELPEDPDVRRDFRFDGLVVSEAQCHLFGLYVGLVRYLKVSSRSLHRWQVRGRMVRNIKRHFYKLPKDSRGGFFPWFLQHQHIFDVDWKLQDFPAAAETWYSSVKDHIPLELRSETLRDVSDPNGQIALLFSYWALNGWYPGPQSSLWITFGFCTCKHRYEEGALGHWYSVLVKACGIEALYKALKARTIFGLFERFGLGQQAASFPYLACFLSDATFLSVWFLKQYCEVGKAEHMDVLWQTYGFMHCGSSALRREKLKQVYARYFEARGGDPLELHDAAVQGRLFDHVSSVIPVNADLQRVMDSRIALISAEDKPLECR